MARNQNSTFEALAITEDWLSSLNRVLFDHECASLSDLFLEDGEWRDLVGLSGVIESHYGNQVLAERLFSAAQRAGARNFVVDPKRTAPRIVERGGRIVICLLYTSPRPRDS